MALREWLDELDDKHGAPSAEQLAAAKTLVGAILQDTASGGERIADAHVVAACTTVDVAIVLTPDHDDIAALAAAVSGTRIITRNPGAPL